MLPITKIPKMQWTLCGRTLQGSLRSITRGTTNVTNWSVRSSSRARSKVANISKTSLPSACCLISSCQVSYEATSQQGCRSRTEYERTKNTLEVTWKRTSKAFTQNLLNHSSRQNWNGEANLEAWTCAV